MVRRDLVLTPAHKRLTQLWCQLPSWTTRNTNHFICYFLCLVSVQSAACVATTTQLTICASVELICPKLLDHLHFCGKILICCLNGYKVRSFPTAVRFALLLTSFIDHSCSTCIEEPSNHFGKFFSRSSRNKEPWTTMLEEIFSLACWTGQSSPSRVLCYVCICFLTEAGKVLLFGRVHAWVDLACEQALHVWSTEATRWPPHPSGTSEGRILRSCSLVSFHKTWSSKEMKGKWIMAWVKPITFLSVCVSEHYVTLPLEGFDNLLCEQILANITEIACGIRVLLCSCWQVSVRRATLEVSFLSRIHQIEHSWGHTESLHNHCADKRQQFCHFLVSALFRQTTSSFQL